MAGWGLTLICGQSPPKKHSTSPAVKAFHKAVTGSRHDAMHSFDGREYVDKTIDCVPTWVSRVSP